MPALSPLEIEFVLRVIGALQFLLLIQLLPQLRRLFLSEAYGGYGDSRVVTRTLMSPWGLVIGIPLWGASAASLFIGNFLVLSSLVLFVIAQYVFIRQRWTNLSRGCGAPGFVSYWLAAASVALAVSREIGPTAVAGATTLLVLDFALIFLMAGIYKSVSGYRQGYGVLQGLANPEWGYSWRFWTRRSKIRWPFKLLDTYGWIGEIAGSVLVLLPWTRSLGALIIASMFVALIPLVRLGSLTLSVLAMCFLVLLAGDDSISEWVSQTLVGISSEEFGQGTQQGAIALVVLTVIVAAILMAGYAGMMANMYGNWVPHDRIQHMLDRVTNAMGLILWRVFTSDIVEFYVRIYAVSERERREVSNWSGFGFGRFKEVTEAITVTSIFTTRRYFPHNEDLFREKLHRYARTVKLQGSENKLEFEYWKVEMDKAPDVRHHLERIFSIEVFTGQLSVDSRAAETSTKPAKVSPVRPGIKPGSYRRLS